MPELKRLAFLWAQAKGYSACAMEVSLPQCRYRADVAALSTAARTDSDRPRSSNANKRSAICDETIVIATLRASVLSNLSDAAQVLEERLRIHYPTLRTGDSLFPEFDSHDFAAIGHRGYARLLRDLRALQNRLYDGTKFDN